MMMSYIWVLLVVFMSGCATTKSPLQKKMADIESRINLAFENPDLWNDFDLRRHPILFISNKDKEAYLYSNAKIAEYDYSELPPELKKIPIIFTADKIKDKTTLVIFLDGFADTEKNLSLISFTIHEAYHLYYQNKDNKSWTIKATASNQRGTLLPFVAEARYLRWEMAQSLSAFLESCDDADLARFSGFYYKWKKDYPYESNSHVDRTEGSAEYVTFAALDKISNKVRTVEKTYEMLKDSREKWFTGEELQFDSEAYLLGVLSGLVFDKVDQMGWKNKVDGGVSNLELLASSYKSNKAVQMNPLKLKEFETLVMAKMNKIDKDGQIAIFLNNVKQKKLNYIALAGGLAKPYSFNPDGMYQIAHPIGHKGYVDLIDVANPLSVQSVKDTPLLRMPPHLQMIMGYTACDPSSTNNYTVWPIDKKMFNKDELLKSNDIQLSVKPRVVKHNGATWLCID